MSAVAAVLEKDLRLLWRHRSGWLSAATFAAISLLVYAFAFDLVGDEVRPLLPGVLWVTFLFAGTIACSRAFTDEVEQGTFDALLLAPVPRTALYAGKVLANCLALLAVEVAVMLLATILFNQTLISPVLLLDVTVGTVGYVSLTTLLSTLGARVRAREVLLPVLSLPLLVPLLIAGVRATDAALELPAGSAPWTLLLVVFTLWSLIASALLFPLAVER
ncbi:MAG: heme exporter protein CcmB [Dehalococcoidia bacterium]